MTILEQLLARSCPHRFAWPRIDDEGRHYQICLVCGTAYEYDWKTMCRTNRLLVASVTRVSPAKTLSGPGPRLQRHQSQ
jgi:hypothetical protein